MLYFPEPILEYGTSTVNYNLPYPSFTSNHKAIHLLQQISKNKYIPTNHKKFLEINLISRKISHSLQRTRIKDVHPPSTRTFAGQNHSNVF